MPPDSPPAAPSQLAIELAKIAWFDLDGIDADDQAVGGLARAFDAKLAPVREAMEQITARIDDSDHPLDVRGCPSCRAIMDDFRKALASLSPQPPEAHNG